MRPRVVVGALVVVSSVVVSLWFVRRPAVAPARQPPPAAAPGPATAPATSPFAPGERQSQQQLARDLVKAVTPDRARWYFSMVVGALPGVTVPPDVARDPHDFDGTEAVLYLYQVWDRLTPDQRAAAQALIHPAGDAHVGALEPAPWDGERPRVLLARYEPESDTPSHDYASLAKNGMNALAQYLGKPSIPVVVRVLYDDVTSKSEFAHTTSFWSMLDSKYTTKVPFDPWHCEITVHDKKFVPLDDISTAAVLTHEATHCYQDLVAGTFPKRASQPKWVAEGEADWAMAEIVPQATQVLEEAWRSYILFPKTVYSDRGYDAIGVFGHFSDMAPEAITWGRLLDVVVASQGHQDQAALDALIYGARTSYFSSWGSSYFEEAEDKWRIASPNAPTISGPAPEAVNLVPGAVKQLSAGRYQAAMATITSDADVVSISLLTGYGRVHDDGFAVDTNLDPSGPLTLCLKQGGCKCADGTNGAGVDARDATSPISIGIDGGDTVATVGIAARGLDDFCQKPEDPNQPPPPPPGNGGGGGGGGGGPDNQFQPDSPGHSTGDPHILTFDGARVEFQRIGEYTLVRSTKDDFVVQVRQVPVASGRWASVNKAVATRIGGHRATVTYQKGEDVLRLDGKVVTGDPPLMSGGTIERTLTAFGTNYIFEWPDGTTLRAEQLGSYGINVRVAPAAARRGALEGLLGDDDGKTGDDETAVAALADKWRVTQATSLFDYLPGQSAATFVDPSFPDAGDGVKDRARAERDCREEGITDPQLLHDCVIDFGITNGFLFRDQYAHQQAVLAARTALMPAGTVAGAADTRTLLMAGAVTDKAETPSFTFTAGAGDIIYIAPGPNCVDRDPDWWKNGTAVIFLSLFDPSGAEVGMGQPGCELGRRVLPAAGTYTLKANLGKNETGTYHVPIRFVRHDRVKSIVYGAIVSGRIEQPGAHDLYTFTARAGDLLQIAGKGCTLSNMFIGVVLSNGAVLIGPNCNQGSVTKIDKDGTYTLLVNSGDAGSGKYQFVFQGVSTAPPGPGR